MQLAIYHLHDRERSRARRETVTVAATIGSDLACDIVINDDPRVAPRHVRLVLDGPRLEPLDGAVMVDGGFITAPTTIRLGATIQIGDTIMRLRAPTVISTALEQQTSRGRLPINNALPPSLRPPSSDAAKTVPPPGRIDGGSALGRLRSLWRTVLAEDPSEQAFLVALRAQPGDAATRMMYADWLEQHGRTIEAGFVRVERRSDDPAIATSSHLEWRAITSRGSIEDCRIGEGDPDGPQCPARWDRLTATDDERLRLCTVCRRNVRYCVSIADAELAGQRAERAVFDMALDDTVAYAALHDRQLDAPPDDAAISLPSIDATPSLDDLDDPAFFTLDDDAPKR